MTYLITSISVSSSMTYPCCCSYPKYSSRSCFYPSVSSLNAWCKSLCSCSFYWSEFCKCISWSSFWSWAWFSVLSLFRICCFVFGEYWISSHSLCECTLPRCFRCFIAYTRFERRGSAPLDIFLTLSLERILVFLFSWRKLWLSLLQKVLLCLILLIIKLILVK